MKTVEVKDPVTARQFINLPRRLYRNDPHWISPLDNDIAAIFDPTRNSFYKHGICTRWILQDDGGNTIGRIAAFINLEKAFKNIQPTGGMGFFECIDDEEAAHCLFDTARSWLRSGGMKAME